MWLQNVKYMERKKKKKAARNACDNVRKYISDVWNTALETLRLAHSWKQYLIIGGEHTGVLIRMGITCLQASDDVCPADGGVMDDVPPSDSTAWFLFCLAIFTSFLLRKVADVRTRSACDSLAWREWKVSLIGVSAAFTSFLIPGWCL